MIKKNSHLIRWIFFLGIGTHFITVSPGESKERLRLVQADQVGYEKIGNKSLYKLTNNVKFIQGDAFLTCQTAHWWETDQKLIMFGNVKIHDGKHLLIADRVDYDAIDRKEEATGHVTLESRGRTLATRSLAYLQDQATVFCHEHVIMNDLIEKAVLEGDRGFYDHDVDYGWIEGNVILTKQDTVANEMLYVYGDKMEAWGEEQRIVITDSIHIKKGDMHSFCQEAVYRVQDHRLILKQDPIIRHRNRSMEGDTIKIDLDGDRFKRGIILGHGRAVSKDSLTEDILKGQKIIIEASQDTIRRIVVENQAEGLYHVTNENNDESGVVLVTGDRIVILFENDQTKRVIVESEPGLCTGQYTEDPKETDIKSLEQI